MRQGFGLPPPVFFLFLVALKTQPGDGNQGSVTGSCSCDRRITPDTPPATKVHIRKYLKAYRHCASFIRFQLPQRSVCGDSQDPWVQESVSCFEHKECGYGHGKSIHHQEHLPPTSTQIPEATEGTPPDTSTAAQIQSTQLSTFPSGARSLNKELTQRSETATLTLGYNLEAGPEAKANEKQQEDKPQGKNPGAAAVQPAVVPVLSLLAIVFLLTAAMVYVLCNRRSKTHQSSAGLQLHYTSVNQDSSV